jgi:Ca-activated chloride channel family protein
MDSHAGLRSSGGAPVPLLGVRVDGDIAGRGARVRILHRFKNMEKKAIEAVYRFPVPETAAVCGFRVRTGDRIIEGAVEEREEAFRLYDEVLAKGHGGYLLDEERPNVLTLSVGNLKPGAEAVIQIDYVTLLDVEEARVRFALPTSISPRYVPGDMSEDDGIPEEDKIHPEYATDVPYGLSMSLRIHGGGLRSIESPSHSIRCDIGDDAATVEFSAQTARMDRDFILYIGHDSPGSVSRAYRYTSGDGVFVQADLVPELPDMTGEARRRKTGAGTERKREIVFVLDCSGSMMGDSITQAKQALEICLKGLEPGTAFNIYRFGSTFDSLFEKPVKYDGQTLDTALGYLARVEADLGGTEMLKPLEHIYVNGPSRGVPGRDIILLTDGEVANEARVIDLVRKHSDTTRVFSLGIGAGPNEHLIRGMAQAGKGLPGFIFPGERIEPKVLGMFRNVVGTHVADVTLEWKGTLAEQAPEEPVVFLGRPITIFCRVKGKGRGSEGLVVRGRVDGRPVHWELKVKDVGSDASPIAVLWARERIRDLEAAQRVLPVSGSRQADRKSTRVKAAIIDISSRYGLLSTLTSYIGIEKRTGKARTRGEVVLRKVPALVTAGWHGIGTISAAGPHAATLKSRMMEQHMKMPLGPRVFRRIGSTDARASGRFPEHPSILSRAMASENTRMLMKILACQQAEGGFEIDAELAKMMQLRVRDLRKLADEIRVDIEVDRFRLLCTALVVNLFATKLAASRDIWEGPADKSIRWLKAKVKRGRPRLKDKPLMDFVKGIK